MAGMNEGEAPPRWQRRLWWAALTAVSGLALAVCLGLVVYGAVKVMGFLQPVLLPFAVAVVLAYLLEPLVAFLCRRGMGRTVATLAVFLVFSGVAGGVVLSVLPAAARQSATLIKSLPEYAQKAQELAQKALANFEAWQKRVQRGPVPGEGREGVAGQEAGGADEGTVPRALFPGEELIAAQAAVWVSEGIGWLQKHLPDAAVFVGKLLQRSVGGFLGAFGFVLGFVLVPVFLFYLLRDAPKIERSWREFLPVPDAAVRDEVAEVLQEINGYVVAFFRGQVLVAVIDSVLITMGLLVIGLDYALLIGVLVATLGIIPYAGTLLTWGPAVLIAGMQFGDWMHPLLVTGIFVAVNQLDSLVISPWVVGESVGLHSLTVMLAVLAWTLIIGGLLGALVAVPLTAALKVLARRYLWAKTSTSSARSGVG